MITKYIIEFWYKEGNKYIKRWEGTDFEVAERMMNKPYYQRSTRRLIKVSEDVLYTLKGK